MTDHRDLEIADLQEQVAVLRRTAGRLAQENGRLVDAIDRAILALIVVRPIPDPPEAPA